MLYEQNRGLLQDCDLILFDGRNTDRIIPKIVARYTKQRHTHIGLAFWIYNRLYILEAIERGVLLKPLSERIKQTNDVVEMWRPQITLDEKVEMGIRAFGYAGRWYDYVGLVKFWFKLAFRLPVKPTDDRRLFCSEFVANTLPQHFNTDEFISPTDLIRIAKFKFRLN